MRRLLVALFGCLVLLVAPASPVLAEDVDGIIARDSLTEIDEIAYSITEDEMNAGQSEFDGVKYIAVDSDRMLGFVAGCFHSSKGDLFLAPAPGNEWVTCAVGITNGGSSTQTASMTDFAIVDANNMRYDATILPNMLTMSASNALMFESIPSDQTVTGLVGFELPLSAKKPLRIEITPMFSFESNPAIAIIVIEDWMKTP